MSTNIKGGFSTICVGIHIKQLQEEKGIKDYDTRLFEYIQNRLTKFTETEIDNKKIDILMDTDKNTYSTESIDSRFSVYKKRISEDTEIIDINIIPYMYSVGNDVVDNLINEITEKADKYNQNCTIIAHELFPNRPKVPIDELGEDFINSCISFIGNELCVIILGLLTRCKTMNVNEAMEGTSEYINKEMSFLAGHGISHIVI